MTVPSSRLPQGSIFARSALTLGLTLGPLLALGLGCSGDHLARPQPVAPDSLYWALELNHHAVTLSLQPPYDTLPLAITTRNNQGKPLPLADPGTPQYSSGDLDRVVITPDGVLRARALTTAGEPVVVTVTLRVGDITHTDSMLVRVVADTLPKLAGLSIHPIPPDSAKTGIAGSGQVGECGFGSPLSARLTDTAGSPIDDPLVAIRSSDPSTAEIVYFFSKPRVTGCQLGTATLIASATVFGVSKADTLPYQVGWPAFTGVEVRRTATSSGDSVTVFQPLEIRVGRGALVGFIAIEMNDTLDVTFAERDIPSITPADISVSYWALHPFAQFFGSAAAFRDSQCNENGFMPTDCDGGGNIILTSERPRAFRVFSTPGTYEYHSNRSGASGRIVVIDERP